MVSYSALQAQAESLIADVIPLLLERGTLTPTMARVYVATLQIYCDLLPESQTPQALSNMQSRILQIVEMI
jgi:hypothetical protein